MTMFQSEEARCLHGNIPVDQRSRRQASTRRRLGVLALALAAGLAAPARAGTQLQGDRLQGASAPPARPTDPAPVEVLAGAGGEAPEQPVHIEITHFAGDTVHGTMWNALAEDGQPVRLHPRELVGMTWTTEECDGERCEAARYRIAEARPDTSTNTMPQHGDNSDVWLYRVEYALASAPGEWHDACDGGDAGPGVGIFVDGHWSEDGAWHPGGWTFSCSSGVIAKCVRSWGYKPWKTLRSPICGAVDLQPLHQACTRAARADYCGDGTTHTRDGTLIDMFDVCGLNVREDVAGFREESAFDEHGALWVATPRWPTAARTRTGWRFATCEAPRQVPDRVAPALIHVWSDPSKGRDAPAHRDGSRNGL